MEQPLEKKSGVRFTRRAPSASCTSSTTYVAFVDKYDTQSPIELARQFIDYHGWSTNKIVLKESNSQYMA